MFPSAVTALTGAGRSRSPERAGRERARLGERESEGALRARGERGRRGRRQSTRWPVFWGKAAPGMRGSAEGAEPEGATPRPAEKRPACSGGRGGRTGEARGGGRARPKTRAVLRGVRPKTPRCQETEGKESTRSGGCGGGLGDRGGATPQGVQLVESEGRSESTDAEYWEREGAGPA